MNSTAPEQAWEFVLPELFKRTEFVSLPAGGLSLPKLTEIAGLYSSMLNAVECVDIRRQQHPLRQHHVHRTKHLSDGVPL